MDDNSVASPCCLQINEAMNIKKTLYRAYVNNPAIRNNHLQHNPTIMFYIYIIYIYIYICFNLFYMYLQKQKKYMGSTPQNTEHKYIHQDFVSP